jgi:hypothetical protein
VFMMFVFVYAVLLGVAVFLLVFALRALVIS